MPVLGADSLAIFVLGDAGCSFDVEDAPGKVAVGETRTLEFFCIYHTTGVCGFFHQGQLWRMGCG
jgi:hypothetical protein